MNTHTIGTKIEALRNWLAHSGARYLVPNVGTIVVVALLLFATRVGAGPSAQGPVPTIEPPDAQIASVEASRDTLSYQGRLTDASGNPINGLVNLTFRLYNVPSGGSALWTEQHTGVQVSAGLFSVLLGSTGSLPLGLFTQYPTLFLGVTVGNDPEMTPREQLAGAPFAFTTSSLLNGATGGSLTLSGQLQVNNQLLVKGTDIMLTGRNSGGTGKQGRALVDTGAGSGLAINYDNDFGKVTMIGDTWFSSNANVGGGLNVGGNAAINGAVSIGGDTTIGGELRYRVPRLNYTTPSTDANARMQTGWGYVRGDTGKSEVSKSFTFPSAFTDAPIVVISPLGYTQSSPGSISSFSNSIRLEVVQASQISRTGFKVIVARIDSSDFTNSFYYGFSWVAVGR